LGVRAGSEKAQSHLADTSNMFRPRGRGFGCTRMFPGRERRCLSFEAVPCEIFWLAVPAPSKILYSRFSHLDHLFNLRDDIWRWRRTLPRYRVGVRRHAKQPEPQHPDSRQASSGVGFNVRNTKTHRTACCCWPSHSTHYLIVLGPSKSILATNWLWYHQHSPESVP